MMPNPVRRSLFCLLAALLAGASTAVAQEGEEAAPAPPPGTALVYVNTAALLPQVPGAQEAQDTFNREVEQYTGEVQALRAEVDSLLGAYQQQEEMLSASAREERQQEIIQKQQQLQRRAAELEQQAGERQQELLRPILDRVGGVIEEIRAENDYTVVFDISAAGVVAADPNLDITRLVLRRLGGDESASSADPGR